MEYKYQFKKDLLSVHKKSRRDYSLFASSDEFELKDGISIRIPEDADDVIYTAVKDFCDYLFVSMELSAVITKKQGKDGINISLSDDIGDANGYMGYEITVSENLITLKGFDSRGVAQGLYFMEDLMNLRCAPFLKKETISRKALFTPRTTHSPFGMMEYPDEALSHIAHLGMDAIDIWIKDGYTTLRDDFIDLRLLSERAEKYGIDVCVSINAPHNVHPDDNGAEEYYDELYGNLFKACPKLKYIKVVGESTQFASRDPKAGKSPYKNNYDENIPTGKPTPGWWPCSDYPEWITIIKDAVKKHSNDNAKVIFSTYNWGYAPKEDRIKLINNLPADIIVMATWNMFHQYKSGNSIQDIVDYSLCFEGPGEYFTSEAEACKKRGIKFMANGQCSGRTWDFGVASYEPMPGKWIKMYKNMIKAHDELALSAVCENIHYGFYPSFINDIEKWAFFTNSRPLEDVLYDILKRDFKENANKVKTALEFFDKGMDHYVPTNEDQYSAFRIGPSYPFWFEELNASTGNIKDEGKRPDKTKAMFGNGIYFSIYTAETAGRNSVTGVRIFDEIKENEKLRDYLKKGVALLKECENPNMNLLKLINLGEFLINTVTTVLNNKKFYILKHKFAVAESHENAENILKEVENLLLSEKENALNTIPLVEFDSRLGWEPSMEYTTDKEALEWKIKQISHELNVLIPKFRKSNNLIKEIGE